MATNQETILEEIECVKAILGDEGINVLTGESGDPEEVHVVVRPATAQNADLQHVIVTLVVKFTPSYPDEAPLIFLRNPRGVDDSVIQFLLKESTVKCEEYLGLPIIFELIQLVRDKLTENNAPSCPCAICLFHFTDTDSFSKTQCFHYFHSYCLGRYLLNCKETADAEEEENQQPMWVPKKVRQIVCPVCREPISEELDYKILLNQPQPEQSSLLPDFTPDNPEIREMQKKMARLFEEQKQRGGIIDLEEEKNRFLITSTETESQRSSTQHSSHQKSTATSHSRPNAQKPPSKSSDQKTQSKKNINASHSKTGRNGQRPSQGKYQRRLQAYENGYDRKETTASSTEEKSSGRSSKTTSLRSMPDGRKQSSQHPS